MVEWWMVLGDKLYKFYKVSLVIRGTVLFMSAKGYSLSGQEPDYIQDAQTVVAVFLLFICDALQMLLPSCRQLHVDDDKHRQQIDAQNLTCALLAFLPCQSPSSSPCSLQYFASET